MCIIFMKNYSKRYPFFISNKIGNLKKVELNKVH